MNEHYEKWDEYAPRGLILIGFGFTMIMRAAHVRSQKKGFLRWVIQFLIGLVSINSGIALFGEAVKERTLYEMDVKELRRQDAKAESEAVTE
ncbi:MAG: hypothetical protein EA396_01275 [Anaerolineaceae bacterium]|nr:MAG: hypothetical protein EA396_01275 [Anaerolineaceae bacterium]